MKRIEHKKLAVLLRIGLLIAALVCAAIFFWFLPEQGRGIARIDPEYAWAFWPCLIFAWLFAVPVFWGMALMWKVFGRIGRGEAFCTANARAMRTAAQLAFFDAVLVPVGMNVCFKPFRKHRVAVGEPIDLSAYQGRKATKEEIAKVNRELEERVMALTKQAKGQ